MLVTGDVLGGDDELIARAEPHRAAGELPEADLRALEVGEDADLAPGRVGPGADAPVGLEVVSLDPVAHVEPRDVHAGLDQRGDLLLA